MKVIYLHQYFLTPDKAGGTRSFELARRLVRAGHEVHMIATDQSAEPGAPPWRVSIESGIHVHWAAVPYGNELGYPRRIYAFLRFACLAAWKAVSLGGDVVFATSTPLTVAVPALVASSLRRTPFVFEVRDMWPDVPIAIGALRNRVLIGSSRWLERLTYRRAAHIVALAPGMREDIVAKGILPEKVTVIPNGCDPASFGAIDATSPRAEFAWLADRKLILFAGTLGLVNGVEYLVRVAEQARALDPELRFVVIGRGRESERVRDSARAAGVLDQTFFMLPQMPKRELGRWLRAADMLVALFTGPRAVWKDAVQNKFFDAVSVGRPIASNFDGWQTRLAIESGIGMMLSPTDPSAAARELVRVLADADWISGVPHRARKLADGPFSRDRQALQLEQVLLDAVQKAGRRGDGPSK